MKYLYIVLFTIFIGTLTTCGQANKMKPLEQLIDKDESAWDSVQQWIREATNKVEVLPKDESRAKDALLQSQITTRSPMGAIVFETDGILVDHGWIRILGSGYKKLDRSLMGWNRGKSFKNVGEQPSFLLIADDVLGGFFALNGGGLGNTGIGKVFYFAPDSLNWEQTDMGYTEFIRFCFSGDLKKFYEGYRWNDWQKDIETLDGNSGISVYPFLWTKEGKDINKDSRRPVPIQELWSLHMEEAKRLQP